MWKFVIPNPFSELPSREVNRLMEITLFPDCKDPPKIGDVTVLLTSGRLTRLDLRPFAVEAEQDSTVKPMRTSSIITLRNLASNSKKFIFGFVRNIISWNPYLEEFYSYIHPGFDVFKECQNLRILRIYSSFSSFLVNNVSIDLSVLSSLRNLEVLHFPNVDTGTIANVLEICPKLISIGQNDSLESLEEIAQKRQKDSLLNFDDGRHFQLQRCVWGNDSWLDTHERCLYKSRFCDNMRFAVALCPLVQELIFYVHTKDAMKMLKFLKHLTFLRIDFHNCEDDFLPDFVALLLEIGPQLKHLSVLGIHHRYPVDVIFDCCPHLHSLQIYGSPFVKNSSEASGNLPLRRLKLQSLYGPNDKESLLFLLSNCKLLEELFLCEVGFFDDALLSEIFKRNPFTELRVSCIEYCNLTKRGYQMCIENAASIETVLIIWDRKVSI
ncbi:hypothetical protein AVEN_264981-1 [Araneus ventricosus]|uniref:F-box domain-containing protein n=1 Tax=Araneus ventricosus TaxID=182803 RepID=A0A4Y2EMU5_ARAVE|nr:hypothetical protein AVEN_264981-1 [Araneus ventricosus]